MKNYDKFTETLMLRHFSSLQEKEKRHYAAIEAQKLGPGGRKYISTLFGISEYCIRTGIRELENPALLADIPQGKQRRVGGGRKKRRATS